MPTVRLDADADSPRMARTFVVDSMTQDGFDPAMMELRRWFEGRLGVRPGISTLLAVGLVLVGCTNGSGSEPDTTVPSSTSTPDDNPTSSEAATASTSMVGDLSSATFDLLDGSELEVVGPASLDLS